MLFGFLMSFGMVLHYIVGARYDTGPEFLKNVTLWYACPWTLSTAVMIGGALGMIAIGTVYTMLGKMVSGARAEAPQTIALTLCTLSLIAIFLTGYVGYFAVDRFWPGFYYSPIKDGKNVWLSCSSPAWSCTRPGFFSHSIASAARAMRWRDQH